MLAYFGFQKVYLLRNMIAVSPADAARPHRQPVHAILKARVERCTFRRHEQADHFIQHRFEAVVERFIDAAKLIGEICSALL